MPLELERAHEGSAPHALLRLDRERHIVPRRAGAQPVPSAYRKTGHDESHHDPHRQWQPARQGEPPRPAEQRRTCGHHYGGDRGGEKASRCHLGPVQVAPLALDQRTDGHGRARLVTA